MKYTILIDETTRLKKQWFNCSMDSLIHIITEKFEKHRPNKIKGMKLTTPENLSSRFLQKKWRSTHLISVSLIKCLI